jgi:hypothetical protein
MRIAICPALEYSAAISTTVRPVTHTDEKAVKSDVVTSPQTLAFLATGDARKSAPAAIRKRNPKATENLFCTNNAP